MLRHPHRPIQRTGVIARLAVLALIVLAGVVAVGRGADAAPGARWARLAVSRAEGDALAQPTAFKTEATAGPWRLTVLEVATGDDANAMVGGASDFNEAPADGVAYVAVKLRAQNAGAQPLRIDGNDFAIAGADGIVRRFVGAIPPDPALDGTVAPGETLEGWVVAAAAAGETNLVLVYDSVTLTGNWADATLALSDGAAIPAANDRAVKANKTGRDPADPAGLDTRVATRDWVVEVTDVVTGADVAALFPEGDYRTIALLGSDPANSTADAGWIAFQVTVTNNRTGDQPGYFPPTAFTLADSDGNPVPDLTTLTPPSPDAAGSYATGASRSGWVLFDTVSSNGTSYDGALLRFLPNRTDADPRYFTWDGSGSSAGSTEPSFAGTLAEGTKVKTTEDGVRLRKEPTTDGEIVAELQSGVSLTVTGAPEEGGGITWYPVEDEKTGDAGYVAQQFISPDE